MALTVLMECGNARQWCAVSSATARADTERRAAD